MAGHILRHSIVPCGKYSVIASRAFFPSAFQSGVAGASGIDRRHLQENIVPVEHGPQKVDGRRNCQPNGSR